MKINIQVMQNQELHEEYAVGVSDDESKSGKDGIDGILDPKMFNIAHLGSMVLERVGMEAGTGHWSATMHEMTVNPSSD